MVNDNDFEKEAFKFLKIKFDKVEWLSKFSMSPIDFKCTNGNQIFYIEAKHSINQHKVRLLPSQKKVDAVVMLINDKISLIWKKDFDNFVIYDGVCLIKVSESIKEKLDNLKDYRRETYNDVINKIIERLEKKKIQIQKIDS